MKKLIISVFNSNPKNNYTKAINLAADFFILTKEDKKRFGNLDNKLLCVAEEEAHGAAFHHELA